MTITLELTSKLENVDSICLDWTCKRRPLSESERSRLREIDDQSKDWSPRILEPTRVYISKYEDGYEAARALPIGHLATFTF